MKYRTSRAFKQNSPPFTGDFRKVSRELSMSRRALAIHRRASDEASESSLYNNDSDKRVEKISGKERNSEPEGSLPSDLTARRAFAASDYYLVRVGGETSKKINGPLLVNLAFPGVLRSSRSARMSFLRVGGVMAKGDAVWHVNSCGLR